MTFAAQMKSDATIFVDPNEFGEAITYTPQNPAGAAKAINALIDPSFDLDLQSLVDTKQSVVILSDEADGIASPRAGDLVAIRGRDCRVFDVITNPDGHHELIVEVGVAND